MDLTLRDLSDLCTWEANLGPPHILLYPLLSWGHSTSLPFPECDKNTLKGTLQDLKLLPYQLRPVLMARILDRSVQKKKSLKVPTLISLVQIWLTGCEPPSG